MKLIILLVEFKQMKLAVLATAIFNNLFFHKAKLSTTIYYDLNILKTGHVFQSVTTVNGGLPYPRASSKLVKHLKDIVFNILQGFKWLHPSREAVHSKLKL
jgi:hypothetical protein